MKDNCERFTGNLRGWKKAATTATITANGYNHHNSTNTTGDDGGGDGGGSTSTTTTDTSSGSYLVKGFYGHTRFATSSKASFDGTHPHQWSPRRMYSVYPFASASASSLATSSLSRSVGVENYITHNGDFEFFHVNGKFYDVEVIQQWLEKVLDVPMPATVDSGEFVCNMFFFLIENKIQYSGEPMHFPFSRSFFCNSTQKKKLPLPESWIY
mgnify:CR=1 FL=1